MHSPGTSKLGQERREAPARERSRQIDIFARLFLGRSVLFLGVRFCHLARLLRNPQNITEFSLLSGALSLLERCDFFQGQQLLQLLSLLLQLLRIPFLNAPKLLNEGRLLPLLLSRPNSLLANARAMHRHSRAPVIAKNA